MANTYNTLNGNVDCAATANASSNFKMVKPNFILSNGAAVYNLGSDPITRTSQINNSSFLGFLFPEKNVNVRPIYVSALVEKQNLLANDDSGGGEIVSSITNTVSDSISAVKDAAVEADNTSTDAMIATSNMISKDPGGSLYAQCDESRTSDCSCPRNQQKYYDQDLGVYNCELRPSNSGGGGGDAIPLKCATGYTYSNGQCVKSVNTLQCIDGYIKVDGKCICNSEDCLICDDHSHVSAGSCVCDSGYEKYNGSCVATCASGFVHTGTSGACACPSGQEAWNGSCVAFCSANSHHSGNDGTCVCNDGYELYNNSCVPLCASDQVRNSSGQCVSRGPICGSNSHASGNNCVCDSGYEMYSGSCIPVCASNQERINGSCVDRCGANQTRINGNCTCNSGYDSFRGSCFPSCTNGKIRFDGSCQCDYGTEWVASANQCKPTCSQGQARNSSGGCADLASYYDIFIDVDGVSKGDSVLNKDVFEFWVSLKGNIYPAPTSAMADNKNVMSAQISYLDPHEKRLTLGSKYSYKEALCLSNTLDDSFVSLGYCGNYKPDTSHCHGGSNNSCSVKLNIPGYK
jgi:hypothetical protein